MTENPFLAPLSALANLSSSAGLSGATRKQVEAFWGTQEKMLSHMEQLTRAWFEHRHEATKSAMQAALKMADSKDPVEIATIYQQWMTGSMGRIAADGRDMGQHVTTMLQEATEGMGGVSLDISGLPAAKPSHAEPRHTPASKERAAA